MKLTLILSILFLSNVSTADQLPRSVEKHVRGFLAFVCPKQNLKELKLVETKRQKVEQTYDYYYSVALSFESGEKGQIQIERLDQSSPYSNSNVTSALLPKNCLNLPVELQLTCGDHWYEVNMTLPLATNSAQFYFSGDSNPDIQNISGRVNFLTNSLLKARIPAGTLTLSKDRDRWSGEIKDHKGRVQQLGSCHEY